MRTYKAREEEFVRFQREHGIQVSGRLDSAVSVASGRGGF